MAASKKKLSKKSKATGRNLSKKNAAVRGKKSSKKSMAVARKKPSKQKVAVVRKKPSKKSPVARRKKDAVLITITISPNGQVPGAQGYLQISNSTQIQFNNTATFPVNVVFTGLFGTVPVPPHGPNSAPLSTSGNAVNYVIKRQDNGVQTGGPYAIQWGNGVLVITINQSIPNIDPIAVPLLGYMQMVPADSDYTIGWTDGNGNGVTVWAPQPSEIYLVPPQPVQQARPGASGPVFYQLTAKDNVQGKGTVHIGS